MGKVTESRKKEVANLKEGIHVFDMALNILQIPWFKENNGHTRIEHIKWITEINREAYRKPKQTDTFDVYYLRACDVLLWYINGFVSERGYKIQEPVTDEQKLYSLIDYHKSVYQSEIKRLSGKIKQYSHDKGAAEKITRWSI